MGMSIGRGFLQEKENLLCNIKMIGNVNVNLSRRWAKKGTNFPTLEV
jgi:hypothetical protein